GVMEMYGEPCCADLVAVWQKQPIGSACGELPGGNGLVGAEQAEDGQRQWRARLARRIARECLSEPARANPKHGGTSGAAASGNPAKVIVGLRVEYANAWRKWRI